MPTTSREIHLVKRPEGELTADDFAMVETEIPDPADGELLVRNLYMSVDPAMRPRMSAGQALNEAIVGDALGRVEASRNPAFPEGALVESDYGFREWFVSNGKGLQTLKVAPGLSPTVYMHALGPTGFTAYGGPRTSVAEGWRARYSCRPPLERWVRSPDRQDQGLLRRRFDRVGRSCAG